MSKKHNRTYLTRIVERLDSLGAAYVELLPEETQQVAELWFKLYCRKAPKREDARIYRNYEWYDFSVVRASGIEREAAMAAYLAQRPALYYVLSENLQQCLLCESTEYPDLAGLDTDVYVTDTKMKWTMVFSHEQFAMEDGPFFAKMPAANPHV